MQAYSSSIGIDVGLPRKPKEKNGFVSNEAIAPNAIDTDDVSVMAHIAFAIAKSIHSKQRSKVDVIPMNDDDRFH